MYTCHQRYEPLYQYNRYGLDKPFGGDLDDLKGLEGLEHGTVGTATSTLEVGWGYMHASLVICITSVWNNVNVWQ